MEIKQLEYFAAAVEYGSLNRAAEKLYTTQPNVSRVLNSLEKELHVTLLERSNKGIRMTQQGEELYGHAMSILKHSNVIRSMSERPNGRRFSVSGYRSGLLTKLMVQLYQNCGEQLKYEYREGTVEEITDNVASRISELGIDIVPGGYQKYGIKALKIETCEPFLAFGYVTAENASLSPEAEQYLERLTAYL